MIDQVGLYKQSLKLQNLYQSVIYLVHSYMYIYIYIYRLHCLYDVKIDSFYKILG